jgi:hypothetical protein
MAIARANLRHACGTDNPVYDWVMKPLLSLALLLFVLAVTGCKTDGGSREFIPGKGWMPMRK